MPVLVSIDDLLLAATWLEHYEGDGDENEQGCCRVADWLREEIARREMDAAVRKIVHQTGCTAARAREAIRQQMSS